MLVFFHRFALFFGYPSSVFVGIAYVLGPGMGLAFGWRESCVGCGWKKGKLVMFVMFVYGLVGGFFA